MYEIAVPLVSPDRARFLAQLPLNQQIQAALAVWQKQVTVQLVRADVPLGRKRTPADYVTVTWTISALEDEAIADKDGPAAGGGGENVEGRGRAKRRSHRC